MLKVQWFVRMDELAKPAIEAYKSGELRIVPERFGKIYLHWLENIRDWCVSRQLWWGHRIPAYYCDCGEVTVSKTAPDKCPRCGGTMTQDEDVLDTWFSSALWPFSTLGWPDKTPDFSYFYPTNLLCCGWEILFFWGVRMVFAGIEMTGKLPFKDLWFHGMVRDENGVKMSKSLGNGVDPLEVIEKYGADALRLSLVMGNTPGEDFRFREEKITNCRNFCNKIWNAARFLLMNGVPGDGGSDGDYEFSDVDKWIISSANRLAREVTEHLDAYDVGLAAAKIYDFIWDEFCDWAIEMSKPVLAESPAARYALRKAFLAAMRLLHPFMPFISEEIFLALQQAEPTIMFSKWPEWNADDDYPEEERAINALKEAVGAVRSIRADMNVPPSRKAKLIIAAASPELLEIYRRGEGYITALAAASGIEFAEPGGPAPENAVSAVIPGVTIYIPLEDLVDAEKERVRLLKEKERLTAEVARSAAKLGNKGFTDKAPKAVVEEEMKKTEEYKEMLLKVEEALRALSAQ
jgi:valyl-tRNA synthetase